MVWNRHPTGAVTVKEPSVLDEGETENVNEPSVPPGPTPPVELVKLAVALGAAANACGAITTASVATTTTTRVARMVLRVCFIFAPSEASEDLSPNACGNDAALRGSPPCEGPTELAGRSGKRQPFRLGGCV